MKPFSVWKILLWSLGMFVVFSFVGCFNPSPFNRHFDETHLNSDYYKDMQERREFDRNYLKISPRLYVSVMNPPYDKTLLYTDSQAIWDQGFVVFTQGLTWSIPVYSYLSGVDPGDLQSDAQGRQIMINLYDHEGKNYYSTLSSVFTQSPIDTNRDTGKYLNQNIRTLVLFTQINGTRGYIKMPPIIVHTL